MVFVNDNGFATGCGNQPGAELFQITGL